MLINHFVEAMFHLNDVIHPAMAVMVKRKLLSIDQLFINDLCCLRRRRKLSVGSRRSFHIVWQFSNGGSNEDLQVYGWYFLCDYLF